VAWPWRSTVTAVPHRDGGHMHETEGNVTNESRLILCGGLQSGGTTLVSWCFLQRPDTTGILDMRHDCIQLPPARPSAPCVWMKMTIGAFRWLDVAEVYQDLGWRLQPLLVVRDVRATYASLVTKSYGFNGLTAEEPPLRTRLRRFLRDWNFFRDNGHPIVRFEDLLACPVDTLKGLCDRMSLEWTDDMVTWPKPTSTFVGFGSTNETFRHSVGGRGLCEAVIPEKGLPAAATRLPAEDRTWLEHTFAEYNDVHGYPREVSPEAGEAALQSVGVPRFDGTKRQRVASAVERLQWIPPTLLP
jgi:hypothetical protein